MVKGKKLYVLLLFLIGFIYLLFSFHNQTNGQNKEDINSLSDLLQSEEYTTSTKDNPFKIEDDEKWISYADIYNGSIVFSVDGNIFLYDVINEKTIKFIPENPCEGKPQIYQNKVVCTHLLRTNNEFTDRRDNILVLYDVYNQKEERILKFPKETTYLFSNDVVVYSSFTKEETPGSDSLFKYYLNAYDINTKENFSYEFDRDSGLINPAKMSFESGKKWENKFVLPQGLIYDSDTNNVTLLHINGQASIYEDTLVWSEKKEEYRSIDIFMKDLQTGQETRIVSFRDSNENEPAIYEDKIVYKKGEGSGVSVDVWVHDLKTGEDKEVYSNKDHPCIGNIKLYKNIVLWTSCCPSTYDGREWIYVSNLDKI